MYALSLARPAGSTIVRVHPGSIRGIVAAQSLYDRLYRPRAPVRLRIVTLSVRCRTVFRASIIEVDDAPLMRECNRLSPIVDAQFLEDVLKVHLHGALGPADDA